MVAFDLFGVILSEGHLISRVLMSLLPDDADKKWVKKQYEAFNVGDISEKEFWNAINVDEYTELRNTFINSFELDPDVNATVKVLKENYQLCILSNYPADWADMMSEIFAFKDNFNPCLFSGYVNCKKPEPEIYQKLISQTGLNPNQIIFIDDRLENLQAAYDQGMKTVYYHRDDEKHQFVADYQIKKLIELTQIL